MAQGPLSGIRVIELAGLGPAPFCAMLLSDLGADVVRVQRADHPVMIAKGVIDRGRRQVIANLKTEEGVTKTLDLVEHADVLIEGYRPGVMERLGLGPDAVLGRNPQLIYARMTGWGQMGDYALRAGHDINYIALSGAGHAIGPKDGEPVVPLNLVGDFGGGALYLAMGILSALIERDRSGQGQVIDCAMCDGSASLMTLFYDMMAKGLWQDKRGSNLLDGGAPYYRNYRCKDGGYVSIGAIEEPFFDELCALLGLDAERAGRLRNRYSDWPLLSDEIADVIATRTRDEWAVLAAGSDACLTPVLSLAEAPFHPHNVSRKLFEEIDGIVQPTAVPGFSRTPGAIQRIDVAPDQDDDVLSEWRVSPRE